MDRWYLRIGKACWGKANDESRERIEEALICGDWPQPRLQKAFNNHPRWNWQLNTAGCLGVFDLRIEQRADDGPEVVLVHPVREAERKPKKPMTQKERYNVGQASKLRWQDPELRARMLVKPEDRVGSGGRPKVRKPGLKGRILSQEHKDRISEAMRGKTRDPKDPRVNCV